MSKMIVLFIDGTNNDPIRGRTNVSRLFRMLDKSTSAQVAYYQPGVGTLDPDNPAGVWVQRIRRIRDLATAGLFRCHVTSAYRYLMQTYEPGDRIVMFGFSRGAYTCRVLAGMLHKVGLLYRGQEEMIPFAWELYRATKNEEAAGRFQKFYAQKVTIELLGLWDTVSSVGSRLRPKSFPSTFDNPSVRHVRHAIALDERRAAYTTNLWTAKPPLSQTVKQTWFAGVHSDVGGGYTGDVDPGLGAIPLAWILREAKALGLVFVAKEEARIFWREGGKIPNPLTVEMITQKYLLAAAHDELTRPDVTGLWWRFVEWLPLPRFFRNEDGRWERKWRAHRGASRPVPGYTQIHESVRLRRAALPDYEPPNLTDDVARVHVW